MKYSERQVLDSDVVLLKRKSAHERQSYGTQREIIGRVRPLLAVLKMEPAASGLYGLNQELCVMSCCRPWGRLA